MDIYQRRNEIRSSQNGLIYDGVKFSSIGSVLAAVVVVIIFGPVSGYGAGVAWLAIVSAIYGARVLDLRAYRRHQRSGAGCTRVNEWRLRVSIGAVASSMTWSSCLWIIFPAGNPAYEALLILWLCGVSGGALATLPYDRVLNTTFQVIIAASVQIRLWSSGIDLFTVELSIFSLYVFGFLMACGKEVAQNYHDLLSLRHDTQETNIALLKTTEEMARLGTWQWPIGSARLELSSKLAGMLGFGEEQVRIADCYRLVHPEDRHRVRQGMLKASTLDEEVSFEYRVCRRGGGAYQHMKQVVKPIVDSKGASILLGTIQDVSDVKDTEARIYRMAYYDELTGLQNRTRFHEHLDHHMSMARRLGQKLAVIYIDLDDFKELNDAFGHEHADTYLKKVAQHLQTSVRRSDYVARMGGDEFAVLIHNLEEETVVEGTVERLLSFTTSAISIGSQRIQPRLSTGIAMYPADGKTPDRLLSCAALAMEHVKSQDKEMSAYYSVEMEATRLERIALEDDLRQALETDQFELWYQPKINASEDRMMGVEALIRWRHPEKGMIYPDQFIETAERVGMIAEIGDWVLQAACKQQAQWMRQGFDFYMAINISGEHFVMPGFVERVASVVLENNLDRGDLEVEITESLSRDPDEHKRVCHELRSHGVRIAIDDFGTGYSSLSVLGDLEIDTLKIDRSFIIGLPEKETSRLMVDTIVQLSIGLGYEIIAEGVETHEQLMYLQSSGCVNIQGYYYSRPVEAVMIPGLAMRSWSFKKAA